MIDVLAAVHRRRGQVQPVRRGVDPTPWTVGFLLDGPDPDTYLCTVSVRESEPIPGVPATPSTYTGVTTVYVSMDPATGRPTRVEGPAGAPVVEEGTDGAPPPTTDPAKGGQGTVRTVTGKVVAPTWSGTWRAVRGTYDRWNSATDVYQAGSGASGPLSGLATYGNQIVALGASSITRARLTLVASGHSTTSSGTFPAVVQGSPSGSRPGGAPSFTGATATVTVGGYGHAGQAVTVDLPADIREGLRTGALKGLGLVGTTYGGTQGTRNGRAWALALDYQITT